MFLSTILKHLLFKNHKVFLSFRLLFGFLKTHVVTIFQTTTLVRHDVITILTINKFLKCYFKNLKMFEDK